MSVLQEYQEIRKELGEEMFTKIETYLEFHPEVLLSDVYYNKEAWNACADWWNNTEDVVKNNVPIIFVIEDYKGISEHNYIGTKEEIKKMLGMNDCQFDEAIFVGDFQFRGDVTYFISVCDSIEDLAKGLAGGGNDEIQDMINRNYANREEYDGIYDDWYWRNNVEDFGEEAIAIAKLYAINCKNPELQTMILQGLDLISVNRLRFSVSQGAAEVDVCGKCIVTYGDDICLKRSDGTFTNGHRDVYLKEVECFINEIGGWGSITLDETFIRAAIKQYPDKIKEKLEQSLPLEYRMKNCENKREDVVSDKKQVEKEL